MKFRNLIFTLAITSSLCISLHAQSVLTLVESSGGCGLVTDCETNTLCLDIVLIPGTTDVVVSYNIWVQYQGTGLVYLSDDACITNNGNDNNFDSLYRVSGIQGAMEVSLGVPVNLHTICFTYPNINNLLNEEVIVGGDAFGVLFSTLTYQGSLEGNLPEFPPLILTPETISCFEPVPVQLLSFDAVRKGPVAALTWSTVHEDRNAGFDIERSVNGGDFISLGFVKALNGTGTLNYSYDDIRPAQGVNYYRLKQVDLDGGFAYSPIRSVQFSDVTEPTLRAWPNPATDVLDVVVTGLPDGDYELTMLNIAGEIVANKTTLSSKDTRVNFDVRHLAPGVYTLIASSNEIRLIERITVAE